MQLLNKSFNIKLLLFILAMISIGVIFWINYFVITILDEEAEKLHLETIDLNMETDELYKEANQLIEEARVQVEFLAKSYSDAINSNNEEDIRFVIDVLLNSINFPIIITSKDEISASMNINLKAEPGSVDYNNQAWALISKMDEAFPPLELVWNNIKWGEIHYFAPYIETRLKHVETRKKQLVTRENQVKNRKQVVTLLFWIPYLEITSIIIFIAITFWGLHIIRKSEKNFIYAGMAKETAHQLGTPISSLMGWIKLLNDKQYSKETQIGINEDINRLSEISERFSKIGSQPRLMPTNIRNLILDVISYMQNHLSSKAKINLDNLSLNEFKINGDSILLKWAFENLIKNSLDAIGTSSGDIVISIIDNKDSIFIDFLDTGRGINRRDWVNIFEPGFSSKPRGWGLGLSLTQRIIKEIHNGNIYVLKSMRGETIIRSYFKKI